MARHETGCIRIGIGGWVYEPWRQSFYPDGLKRADELAHAASRLGAIEINATFYRTQSEASFAQWAASTPAGFVFAVKAARGAAQRIEPEEAAPSIARFLGSGLEALGDRLGPILWQLPAGRRFDADRLPRFLDLLPDRLGSLRLRHALEAAHESFSSDAALTLLAERNVASVWLDTGKTALRPALTADFAYLRLEGTRDDEPDGYAPAELDLWTDRLRALAAGMPPPGLDVAALAPARPRDVFAFVISGAKHRNPAAAMALARRLRD